MHRAARAPGLPPLCCTSRDDERYPSVTPYPLPRMLNLLLTGLMAGSLCWIWLGEVLAFRGLPASRYLEVKQLLIPRYDWFMPKVIGGAAFSTAMVMIVIDGGIVTFLMRAIAFVCVAAVMAISLRITIPIER